MPLISSGFGVSLVDDVNPRSHILVDDVNLAYDWPVDSTRERLIEAAARLLDEGGPAAVTLREVGRLAGVSHNAPYKHFADKQDLLAAVAARELARQPRQSRQPRQPRSPSSASRRAGGTLAGVPGVDDDAVRSMMRGYIRWATRYPARFKLTFGSWSSASAELGEAASAARSALVRAVEAGQAARTLPDGDPDRLAALLLAVTHGAVDLALSGHLSKSGKGHASPEDLVDDLLRHLRPAG